MERGYYVYMIRCTDNSLYTGITTDVKRRFAEHASGGPKGAKYTKKHAPKEIAALWQAEKRLPVKQNKTIGKGLLHRGWVADLFLFILIIMREDVMQPPQPHPASEISFA